jgi:hypothetical protein
MMVLDAGAGTCGLLVSGIRGLGPAAAGRFPSKSKMTISQNI